MFIRAVICVHLRYAVPSTETHRLTKNERLRAAEDLALTTNAPGVWHARDKRIVLDRPIIVGILNVTPDSFSDGGRLPSVASAIARATEMLDEGADIIDVGGESTGPKAAPVSVDEELARVLPVIEGIRALYPGVPLSVDTTKAVVGAAALDAGADIVNDVSGFRLDPPLCEITAGARAGAIIMHSRGAAGELSSYQHATYGATVIDEVVSEVQQAVQHALAHGVARESIVIDPGIGFAKTTEHSLAVLARLERFVSLGFPVLVGASRKRFIGALSGARQPNDRLEGTLAAHVAALLKGAHLFRVHDVRAHRRGLAVAWAIRDTAEGGPE